VVLASRLEADRRGRFVALPDGSKLELLGTAAGAASFTTDTGWRHLVRRCLPNRFRDWLPVFTGNTNPNTSSNMLTIFLRRTTKHGAPFWPQPWSRIAAEDDSGFQYLSNGSSLTTSASKDEGIYGLNLPGYPRRQREFLLRFANQNGTALATFHVPNPLAVDFPKWQPLPTPQTQTNGAVQLTLESVEKSRRSFNPEYRLRATDPAWLNAKADFEAPEDATGNYGVFASPREPAWKLRALVDRNRIQDFAAGEQLVLTNLPLPAPGQFLSVDRSAESGGIGLKVLVLAGAGTFGLSNGTTRFMLPPSSGTGNGWRKTTNGVVWLEEWFSTTPFLMVEARNLQANDEVQVYFRDQSGHVIKAEPRRTTAILPGAHIFKFPFDPPEGASSLDVTVVVSRPLSFEFLINPADVRPEKR
jgi:hypothetical protein